MAGCGGMDRTSAFDAASYPHSGSLLTVDIETRDANCGTSLGNIPTE
jgi:hypothetical protein